LLVALCLVIGISNTAFAVHPILDVTFHINWFPLGEGECYPPFNVNAVITLLNDEGVVLVGWMEPLACEPGFDLWTYSFFNVPDEAVSYRIDWEIGPPTAYVWNEGEESPMGGEIDWQEEVIDRIAEVWCIPVVDR